MKDPVIASKVDNLQSLIAQINSIMSDLQDMNVEVRIAYTAKDDPTYSTSENLVRQSIKLWKVEERNGYI